MTTFDDVAAALVDVGLVTAEHARTVLDKYAAYDDGPMDGYSVACALEEFGAAVSVHADDVDYLEESYEGVLERAAALTGGAFTVTGVRLHEGEFEDGSRDDVLEFEVNGRNVSVNAEHMSDEYLDHIAASFALYELSPGDGRRFRDVLFDREPGRGYDSIFTLVTDEQAAELSRRLGLRI